MAKAAIRHLKDRRFWRWLCCEVYGKPAPKQPIKLCRKRVKFRKREFERMCDRGWIKAQAMLEEYRQKEARLAAAQGARLPAGFVCNDHDGLS